MKYGTCTGYRYHFQEDDNSYGTSITSGRIGTGTVLERINWLRIFLELDSEEFRWITRVELYLVTVYYIIYTLADWINAAFSSPQITVVGPWEYVCSMSECMSVNPRVLYEHSESEQCHGIEFQLDELVGLDILTSAGRYRAFSPFFLEGLWRLSIRSFFCDQIGIWYF